MPSTFGSFVVYEDEKGVHICHNPPRNLGECEAERKQYAPGLVSSSCSGDGSQPQQVDGRQKGKKALRCLEGESENVTSPRGFPSATTPPATGWLLSLLPKKVACPRVAVVMLPFLYHFWQARVHSISLLAPDNIDGQTF